MFADETVQTYSALALVLVILIGTVAMGVAAGRRR